MWPGRKQARAGKRRSLRCCASLELTEENVEAVLLVGHCALPGAPGEYESGLVPGLETDSGCLYAGSAHRAPAAV